MAGHTSEKRWADKAGINGLITAGVSSTASNLLKELVAQLNLVEEAYQQMQEIYAYTGGTVQGLAEQLFKEDIAARVVPGTDAVVTIDIDSGGSMDAVYVDSVGGTGYTNGLGYRLVVTTNRGSNAEIKYDVVNGSVTNVTISKPGSNFDPGTGVVLTEFPSAGFVPGTTVSQEELDKASDIVNAMTSAHQLYQAANNVAITQADRLTEMRRMI